MGSDAWSYFQRARGAEDRSAEDHYWRLFVRGIEPEMRGFTRSLLWRTGAMRKLGDLVEVDDVLCDALVRLYRVRDRVERPRAWLYVVVKTIVIGYLRDEPGQRASEEELDSLSDPSGDLRQTNFITRRKVRQAIRRLPRKDSRLIIAVYYLNVGRKELAHVLGIKTNSVDQRISRAVRKLGALLARGAD